jgi:hypothetical protein
MSSQPTIAERCASELNNIYASCKSHSSLLIGINSFNEKYNVRSLSGTEVELLDGVILVLDGDSAKWDVKHINELQKVS